MFSAVRAGTKAIISLQERGLNDLWLTQQAIKRQKGSSSGAPLTNPLKRCSHACQNPSTGQAYAHRCGKAAVKGDDPFVPSEPPFGAVHCAHTATLLPRVNHVRANSSQRDLWPHVPDTVHLIPFHTWLYPCYKVIPSRQTDLKFCFVRASLSNPAYSDNVPFSRVKCTKLLPVDATRCFC